VLELLKTVTRKQTDLQAGAAVAQVCQKGKRLSDFCQLASVMKDKEADSSVRNIMFDSFGHHTKTYSGRQWNLFCRYNSLQE